MPIRTMKAIAPEMALCFLFMLFMIIHPLQNIYFGKSACAFQPDAAMDKLPQGTLRFENLIVVIGNQALDSNVVTPVIRVPILVMNGKTYWLIHFAIQSATPMPLTTNPCPSAD